MDEQLVNAWEKLKLTDDENTVLDGANSMIDDENPSDQRLALSLVGKLLTKKPFNVDAMKRVLQNLWRIDDNVAIRSIDTNLFVFQFFAEEDKMKVLEGRPWAFDNQILLLKEVCADEQPSDVSFDSCPFWIRLLDVPFGRRSPHFAREVGDCIGECLEVDESDPLCWEEYMRVKVLVNIHKPLRRGIKIAVESGLTKWVGFKYERLCDFCYFCGRIGHIDKDCEEKEKCNDDSPLVFQYGPFLTASPHRSKVPPIEREREKKWMEKIAVKGRVLRSEYNDPAAIRLGPPGAARKLLFSSPKMNNDITPKPRAISLMAVADEAGAMVLRPSAMQNVSAAANPAYSSSDVKTCEKQVSVLQRREKAVSTEMTGGEDISAACKSSFKRKNRGDGAVDMDVTEGSMGNSLSKKRVAETVTDGDCDLVDFCPEKKLKLSDNNFSSNFVVSKVEGLGNVQALEKQ